MAPLLAFLAIALAPSTVSFHADSVRVETLVADLARQSGLPLVCAAAVRNEPVVVDFEDQPVEDVLEKLASVVGAEWQISETERRLTRTSSLRAKQQREERAKILAAWTARLKETAKEVDGLPEFDERAADRLVEEDARARTGETSGESDPARVVTRNPVFRTGVKLLSAIGPKEFTRMSIGERVVYSDAPTPMQRPLPLKARAAIDALKTHALWLIEARERLSVERPSVYYPQFMPQIGRGSPHEYGKTVFAVSRTALSGLRYSLTMVDAQGRLILSGIGSFPDVVRTLRAPHSHRGEALQISNQTKTFALLQKAAGVAMASGGSFALEDGTEIRLGYAVSFAEVDGMPIDRGLGKYLSDPVTHDPIGPVFGNLIRQVAKNEKRSLLATAPDYALYRLARGVAFEGIQTHEDLLEYLTQSHVRASLRAPYAEVEKEEGWLIVRLAYPVYARSERFDRAAARFHSRNSNQRRCDPC